MTKRPTPATLAHFDRRSASEDDRIAPFLREMHHALLDNVRPQAWSRVLSVECGNGWVAEEAWRRLGRGYVHGVDISPSMTDLASRLRRVDGQLEFSVWDGRRLPFADAAFDYVLSTFAFHRFSDPLQSLQEMRRVLEPGGAVYLLEPDRKSFRGLYALWDYYSRLTDPGHIRYYNAEKLLGLMRQAGFIKVEELLRSEKVLSGGKVLASAVILRGELAT